MTRSRQRAFKLATATASGLFAIALIWTLGELSFRLVLGNGRPYELSELATFDERLGWRLKPGEYDFFNPEAFTAPHIEINELGVRGGPLSLKELEGRRRISVVGDSFVFAAALSEGLKLTDLLQQKAGPEFEIVNIGVPGYGTGQQILLLEELFERGLDFGDSLILLFFTNDILDNVGLGYGPIVPDPTRPAFGIEDAGLVEIRRPHQTVREVPPPSLFGLIRERSLFACFVETRLTNFLSTQHSWVPALAGVGVRVPLPRTPGVISAWYAPGWDEHLPVTVALLERLKNRSVEWGVETVTVAFVPSPFQVEEVFREVARGYRHEPLYSDFLDDPDRPQRTLLESCAAAGLRCIDLTGPLRDRPDPEPVYFLREGHLNERGSAIVAEVLYEAALSQAAR